LNVQSIIPEQIFGLGALHVPISITRVLAYFFKINIPRSPFFTKPYSGFQKRMHDPSTSLPTENIVDPFVLYARSLHNYTLGLWTETRRIAEEKARARQLAASLSVPTKVEVEDKKKEKENTSPSQLDESSDKQK